MTTPEQPSMLCVRSTTPHQLRLWRAAANARGITLSELVRDALDRVVMEDMKAGIIGAAPSGRPTS